MKIKLHWSRSITGVTEMDVDPAEVLAWINDPLYMSEEAPVTEVTPELVRRFLDAGDGQELEEAIDFERDHVKDQPWHIYDVDEVELL